MWQNFVSSYWAVPTVIAIPFLIWDLLFSFGCDHGRKREDYIKDIRALNQYCSYYFAFITILAGLLISKEGTLPQAVTFDQCLPFAIAILAASLSIVFLPVTYGNTANNWVKGIWLRSLMCQKIVVVFTMYGLVRFANDALA